MNTKSDLEARSPWSKLNEYTEVLIKNSPDKIKGAVTIPGSKSFTNRALIIAAFAQGESELNGILRSDDTYWCIKALQDLGLEVSVDNKKVRVVGLGNRKIKNERIIYIGAAGTTARFLPGLLAARTDSPQIVKASKRMSERPILPLIESLQSLGQEFKYLENYGKFPLVISPSEFKGGKIEVSGNKSSQFISGLLIAAPFAANKTVIRIKDKIVQYSYVKITIDLMKKFGVHVDYSDYFNKFEIEPQNYQGANIHLEADISTSCYFFAMAAITGGIIKVNNINHVSNQPDLRILEILEKMGCYVIKEENSVTVKGPEQLIGNFTVNMNEMSDQALTIAALAPFATGPINITNVEHIRHHESDRIAVMTQSLIKIGINVEERADGWVIYPGKPKNDLKLSTFDDHRVAMSLSLIALKVGNIRIQDPGCVSKTCPDFFSILEELNVELRYIKDEKDEI